MLIDLTLYKLQNVLDTLEIVTITTITLEIVTITTIVKKKFQTDNKECVKK